jgi:shikimate kinase
MGTGKSTVGKLLADRLKRPFIDLDRMIEKSAGKTVAEIFSEQGEEKFRQLETEAVRKVVKKTNAVIATGGGVLLKEENVRLLKNSGTLVCLTAGIDQILKRIGSGKHQRPLLAGEDPRRRIEQLLSQRASCYAQADWTISSDGLTVKQTADRIKKELNLS